VGAHLSQMKGASALRGDTAFLLHDTFGFPIDLTLEIAEEAGLTVDRAAFDELMMEQRTRAKADARAKKRALADLSVYSGMRAAGETVFTGYDYLQTDSKVLGILVDGHAVDRAFAGDIAEVILAETALYPESGGQAADAGAIVGNGFDLEVLDVQRPVKGLISHTVQVSSGEVSVGAAATSVVDPVYRHSAAQAHSATHLVHAALRQTLGSEAHQSGSYNKAGYLRLDFAWNQALSPETRGDLEVTTRILPIAEAKAAGAMALFGEKYGDTVRMVDIGGPWSRELCAGIHVRTSAEVGLVNLISESSVGSTNRRVEALVGLEAFRDLAAERAIVSALTSSLRTPREMLPQRIESLVAELKAAEKKIAAFEASQLSGRVPALVEKASRVGGYLAVVEDLGTLSSADELRSLAISVRERLGSVASVVALAARVADKPAVIVATSPAARDLGAKAGVLAKQAAAVLGGGGGGKDDLAQGGGSNTGAIGAALSGISAALQG
jgi:alanyl-tRNA synthetase